VIALSDEDYAMALAQAEAEAKAATGDEVSSEAPGGDSGARHAGT
jgi:hypothetical protein